MFKLYFNNTFIGNYFEDSIKIFESDLKKGGYISIYSDYEFVPTPSGYDLIGDIGYDDDGYPIYGVVSRLLIIF